MPPVLAPYTFYTGCRRVCGNVVQGFYSFNYKYEINTNLMVLYFADTTARSKFACNFSSSFSFFSSVHFSIKNWKCCSAQLDLTVPTTVTPMKTSLKSRHFVFLNFLSRIPRHLVTEKQGNQVRSEERGLRPSSEQRQ